MVYGAKGVSGVLKVGRSNIWYRGEAEKRCSHEMGLRCNFIVRLHNILFVLILTPNFLIDSNMSTTVVMINKLMHLVKFYFFAVIKLKYRNSLKSYIHLKLTAF